MVSHVEALRQITVTPYHENIRDFLNAATHRMSKRRRTTKDIYKSVITAKDDFDAKELISTQGPL